MTQAITLAEKSLAEGGGPFGAVIVQNNQIIGTGSNRVTLDNDPTAHAEMQAIRAACQTITDFQLADCTIYVNCEPCPMCLAALYWAGIKAIYFAADRNDAAGIGFADNFIYQEFAKEPAARQIAMHQIMRTEALHGFQLWEELEDKIPY
ncbi:MAG: nucleoside deaminase [Proteobacteria bacterium]|nr:nucleoside deaminase [Pseudomonadota bacterium]MBU1639847.1 nucleoside deaminase [Pseudomonadota bacterium]